MALIDDRTDRDDGLHAVRAVQSGLGRPLHSHGVTDDDDAILPQGGDHFRERSSHPHHIGLPEGLGSPANPGRSTDSTRVRSAGTSCNRDR